MIIANKPKRARGAPLQRTPARGVAMLLVLVALSVGVVLAGVALTSRQPAMRIGENACDDAAARWGAHAAAGYAQAVLETSVDSVDFAGMSAGGFIQSFQVDGGSAKVTLARLDGSVPQMGDREILMTAVATVGSMVATVQKRVSLANPVLMSVAADVRLGEFAVFAGSGVTIDDGAVVATSSMVSEPGSLTPVKIGTGFSGASALQVDDDADIQNVALYIDKNASASMNALLTDSDFSEGFRLPYAIPLIREVSRPEVATLPFLSVGLPLLSGVTQSLAGGNYGGLNMGNGAVVTLGQVGQTTVYKFSSIVVPNLCVLRFAGQVIVQVSGATSVQGLGAIEPASADSRLEMYLGRNVTIDDAAVGLPRAVAQNGNRKWEDVGAHAVASQVYLSTLNTASGGSASPAWTIKGKSIVLASIHAPQSTLTIEGDSTLIGRATCGTFTLRSKSNVFYDPRLDSRAGFTEMDGPLYIDRLPIPEVTSLFSTVSSASGAQVFQSTLKSTLDAAWAAAMDASLLVKQPAGSIVPAPTGVPGLVVVDNTGTADARVRGKAKSSTKADRAKGFED